MPDGTALVTHRRGGHGQVFQIAGHDSYQTARFDDPVQDLLDLGRGELVHLIMDLLVVKEGSADEEMLAEPR